MRAGEAFAVLGQPLRDSLTRTGLLYHPLVVERLAGAIYEHAFNAATPRGERRLRERYE